MRLTAQQRLPCSVRPLAAQRAALRRPRLPALAARRSACSAGRLTALSPGRRVCNAATQRHGLVAAAVGVRSAAADASTPDAERDGSPPDSAAAKLGLAACSLALLNAVALGCAWLFRSERFVVQLSGSLLALCAAAFVDVVRRAGDSSTDAQQHGALQLVLESACVTLVAVQSLEGLQWLAFSHAGAAAVARAVLPVACCAWVCRLGMGSPLWAEHGAAVAAADHAVARAAAEGTAQRLLDVSAPEGGRRLKEALQLVSRSGKLWRRIMAALSVADWALLAALWWGLEPVAGLVADAAAAAWYLPAMLALDGARLGTQALHSAARGRVAGAHHPSLFLLPAGVSSRLSLGLLFTNVACSGALVALALALRGGVTPALLPRAVLSARFVRLICECAFLVAVGASRRGLPVAPLRLRGARDTLAACDAAACVADWTKPPPALPPLAQSEAAQSDAGLPRLGLDAFSSLVQTGVRGYLRGREAAEAVARVFSEADKNADGKVTIAEIASWVEREAPDGGGVRWRASVRRVLGSLPGVAAPASPAPTQPLLVPTQPLLDNRAAVRFRPRGLRLLSLEGGGIKGLALIWQLQAIEKQAGRPIHELFDLIGGTSTGGLLALALSNRIPLSRLEEVYAEVASDVFAQASLLRQLRYGHSADSAPLERILRAMLGDDTLMRRPGSGYGPAAFVVTTRSEPSASGAPARLELRLLRTYASAAPSGGRDSGETWTQWQAALATSAAPTVLPPVRRADGSTFVDGALSGNNNPSLLVLTEGLQMAAANSRPLDIMLSLGCGEATASTSAVPRSGAAPSAGSVVFWLGQVVNLAFDASLQEERTARLLAQVCPTARYARLSPALRVDCALAEFRPAPIAAFRADTAKYLREHAPDVAQICEWLAQDKMDNPATTQQLSDAMLL